MLRFLITLFVLVTLTYAADLSQAHKNALVNGHNDVRQKTGAHMDKLVWNNDLAKYADQVHRGTNCKMAQVRAHKYAENLYWSWSSPFNGNLDAAITSAVNNWAAEKKFVRGNNWGCIFEWGSSACGHYSQMVWANTKQIGCAIHTCPNSNSLLVSCEYFPMGNYWGQKPY